MSSQRGPSSPGPQGWGLVNDELTRLALQELSDAIPIALATALAAVDTVSTALTAITARVATLETTVTSLSTPGSVLAIPAFVAGSGGSFYYYNTAASQSLAAGYTDLTIFDTLGYDANSEYNKATGIWTVANTGLYLALGVVQVYQIHNQAKPRVALNINSGTSYRLLAQVMSGDDASHATDHVEDGFQARGGVTLAALTAGDSVALSVRDGTYTGGSSALWGSGGESYFCMTQLR